MRNIVKTVLVFLLMSQPALANCSQLRIMPLGNSITRGVLSTSPATATDIGYRKALYNSLDGVYSNLDFVGSLSTGDGTGFDEDHEGHGGWMANEIRDEVKTWLNNNPADVVLLHIGTNDIGVPQNLADIVDEVATLLDNIDAYESENNTEVVVFIARIIRLVCCGFTGAETTDFNSQIAAMVNQRVIDGDKLYMVDQESALTYPGDLEPDLIHPTQAAYDKMAAVWEQALTSTLAVPLITDPGAQAANVGENFEYQIMANGVHTPAISVSNLPTGMTYDAGTQTVSWVPGAGQEGAASFDVLASNALGDDNLTINMNVGGAIVNPPTSADASVTTDEDVAYNFVELPVPDFPFTDIDGEDFAGIRVVTLPVNGLLTINGVGAVAANDLVADVTTLVFTPGPNDFGTSYTSFTFKVRNNVGEESVDTYTMTIDVNPVNDLPEGDNESVTTDEDVPHTFQDTDFTANFSDGDGATFDGIQVVTLPLEGTLTAGGAVAAGQVISNVANLVFTPATDANGTPYTTFTFKVRNNVGEESVNTYTMTINVTPVNDLPEGDNGSVTTDEDVPHTFQNADFNTNFSDGDGATFDGIQVVTLPGAGTLTTGGTVSPGQVISNVANLNFTPATNGNGTPYTTFTFKVRNDDGEQSTANYTMTINVTPVNDPPSFTKGPDQSVNEDAGLQTVNAWATDLDDGDPDATQTLEFEVTDNTNPSLFATQPVVSAMGGTLTYEPAANASGTATITVEIKDNGSDTPPNVNIGNSETFDIEVIAVNDEPQVNNTTGKTAYVESPVIPFVVIDGGVTVSDVDNTNLISGTVAFTDTYIKGEDILNFIPATTGITGIFDEDTGVMQLTGNRPVSEYQIVLASLQYVNGAGVNPTGGDREITFSVFDGNLTGSDTKIVTVVTDNSAPNLVNGDIDDVTVEEDAPNFTIQLFNVFQDAEDEDVDLVFAVDNNTNAPLFNSTDINPTTGVLTLDFADDAFGTADLTVSATDTDNGSTSTTFTVTVNAVNDKPTTSGIPDVDVNEDAPNTVINLWDHFADPDNADSDLVFSKVPPDIPGLFSNIIINNAAGTLTLDYSPNAHGIASITIRATDPDGLSEDATFAVDVAPINDAPLLSVIPSPAPIIEDAGEQVINLTGINAGPNETQILTVTANTASTGLLTIAPVEYTSPNNTGVLRYTPVANASGTAGIQVCVADNGPQTAPNVHLFCRTFTVVVNPDNDNPTLDPIPDPSTIFVNAGEQCVSLSGISAGPGENQTLSVSAGSSNTSLIPNDPPITVNYTSPDATGQVCYTPLPNQFGSSTILVTVTDSEGGTKVENFNVVVSPVNQEPTIDQVSDIVIDEDATPDPLTLTGITAGTGESQDLTFALISDNTDLFDPEGTSLSVNYNQGDPEGTLLYTPIENASGEANITIRLTDTGPGSPPNDNQKEITFKITVNAINDAPTLDEIPDQGIFDLGEEPSPVNLTGISGGPKENQPVSITFSSDNPSIVDPAKILVDFDPANDFGSLTYTIEPNLEGEANITVCVNDEGPGDPPNVNSFCRTFKVTVSGASDLEITNATLTINEVSRGQIFRVNSSIRNNGNEVVESTFLNFYISGDDVFDDGADDLIGLLPIGPISADGVEKIRRSEELKVSETTPAGTYYIIVVVDKTNNIPELNEDNNIFVMQIVVNSNRFPEIAYNNAPPLLLTNDQFINYRVVVTDDELNTDNPVKFFYRGISSDKEFTQGNAEEIEESLYQFTIDREEFLQDPIGLEYYFNVTDIGRLVTQTEVAYTYEQYAEPGLIFHDLRYGGSRGDYQMVSVPLVLDNSSPDEVFEDDFLTYNKEKWRLFRFQGGGNVENKDGLDAIDPGNAYWLIVKNEPGTPVDTGPGITTQVTKQDPFVIPLRKGWNQIGSPYNFNVSWSDVISFNNDPNGVKTVLREYQPGGGYQESDVLRAFGGAFVESEVTIDIMIPVIRNNSVQTGRFTSNTGSTPNQQGDWEVKIDLLTSQFSSRINGFGMKNGASYGNDRYDASSSPGIDFINNIELKFDHPEHFQKSLAKDIRPVASSEIWEFSVATEASSGFATMQWGDVSEQVGDKELYLYDIGNGKVIDMLNTTSYEVDLSSSRVFKAYYGTKEFIDDNLQPESIYLGQSYPNPFTNFTHIPFTLAKNPANYQLELSIFNLMGQKVKALASGEFEPGFYELEWNGKNEKGNTQPSGVYLYKLVVKSQDGNDQSFHGRAILR